MSVDDLRNSADEGTLINGWKERSALKSYIGLESGASEGRGTVPYDIIKRLLLLMKKINDSKRQTSTMSSEMGAGFISEFQINSKEFKVVSNAGMMAAAANINMAVTNILFTPKRLMSIMTPSSLVIDHPSSSSR